MAPSESGKIFTEIVTEAKDRAFQTLCYFLLPRWKLYALAAVVSLLVSLFEGVNLAIILPLFSSLLQAPGQTTSPEPVLVWLYRIIDLLPLSDKVIAACVLLILLSLVKLTLTLVGEFITAYATGLTFHETKKAVLEKYYRFPYAFFLEHKQGDLKHVVLMSTQRVSYCLWILTLAITEGFKIIAILGLLMLVNPQITFAIIVTGVVFYFLISAVFQKVSYRQGKMFSARQMEMTNLTDEMLTGTRSIMVFGAFPHWLERFLASSLAQTGHQIRQRIVLNIPKNALETGIVVGFLAVILLIHWMSPGQALDKIPMMGLIGIAVMKLWPSLHQVNRARLDLVNQLSEVELVYRVLTSSLPEARSGGRPFKAFKDSIAFTDVTFAYPTRVPILDGLSFRIEKDKVTAIVGRTGEGKTTIINLLLGLYEPQRGAILVDGSNLSSYDIRSWQEKIGFVPQDPFLYHATVADNIAFGDETTTREATREAARIALADEFIEKLPDSYDTVVGDRGLKLSGGQQQRIAIARAILRNPQILVFDEATSSLDTISERLVQETIARTSKNRTVLLIAHRLSTIQHADKIIVLEKGRCVEEGTHDQLAHANGAYFRLIHATSEPVGQ